MPTQAKFQSLKKNWQAVFTIYMDMQRVNKKNPRYSGRSRIL